MFSTKNYYWLIIFSMLLLAGFLYLYLQKSYAEAEDGLKNELVVSLNQVNNEIKEGQLKDVFLFLNDTVQIDSVIKNKSLFFSSEIRREFKNDKPLASDNVSIYLTKNAVNQVNPSANVYLKNGFDSLRITELIFNEGELKTLDSIWQEKLVKENLPPNFFIEKVDRDYTPDSLHVIVRDASFLSKDRYIATFSDSHWFILKKISPQLLFSLLLYCTVGAAFFFTVRALRFQEKIGQLKNDFINNMTHELKTPISTVGVAIEAMQNFDVLSSPDKTEEYLSIAENELNRLTLLVEKVLKMSQFDSKAAPLGKMTITDFDEIVQNVSKSMQLQLEKGEASLDLNFGEGNFQIKGDKVHLANIVYNLMDNALKYSSDKPKISIRLLEKSEEIFFSIKDNGIGIPKEYQPKIFDQFFRVPTGNIHDVKGYGLGLSYVAKVVKAHGGKIKLHSNVNSGTEFIIELPKHG